MCTYTAIHCVAQTAWTGESKQVWPELPYTISCLEDDLFAVEYNVVSRCLLSDEVFASLKPQFLSGDIMREDMLYSMDLLPPNPTSIDNVLTSLDTPAELCPLNTATAVPFDILKHLATFCGDGDDNLLISADEQTLVSPEAINLLKELESFGNSNEQQTQVLPEFSVYQGTDGLPIVNIDGGVLLAKLTQPETSANEDVRKLKRKLKRKLTPTATSPEEDALSVWMKSPYVLHYAYKDVSFEDSLITSVALSHAHQDVVVESDKERVSSNRRRHVQKHVKRIVNSFCKIFSVPSNADSEMLKEALAKQGKTLVLFKSLENIEPASGNNIIAVVCSPCGIWFPGSRRFHSWITM
jgi:hypothetical protein